MDEIDAALDFKNVSIVANYIKERTRNAQFIIISLRNYMFELADRLVGVSSQPYAFPSSLLSHNSILIILLHLFMIYCDYAKIYKTEDCTKSVTINPSKFATPGMRSAPA